MVLTARRVPEWKIDAKNVLALSGVLLLHILVLGMMFLPRAPLQFSLPQPDLVDIPLEFEPVVPPKLPPPPIVVPPPPLRLYSTPPPAAIVPARDPTPMTTATEVTLDTPTETPILPRADFDSGNSKPADTGAGELRSLKTKFSPPPVFPRRELTRGRGGRVELRVLVGADGLPQTVEVIGGSGNRNLELAAIRGVKRWRFHPYTVDGVARPAWALVPIVFRVEN